MLSSMLQSDRAVQVNIAIVRTFARLRQILATHKELGERLAAMEKKYDQQFKVVFDILGQLMEPPPEPAKRPMGFVGPGRKALAKPKRVVDPDDVLTPAQAKRVPQSFKPTRQGKTRPWAEIRLRRRPPISIELPCAKKVLVLHHIHAPAAKADALQLQPRALFQAGFVLQPDGAARAYHALPRQ